MRTARTEVQVLGSGLGGSGTVGIKPLDVPGDAIGLRYVQRVEAFASLHGGQHVLCSPKHLTNERGDWQLRAVEVAVFAMTGTYRDDAGCPGWPPPRMTPRPSVWVRVGNDPQIPAHRGHAVGIRPDRARTAARFPRANHGFDGHETAWGRATMIDCVSQFGIVGSTTRVQLVRGDAVRLDAPAAGWGHRWTGSPPLCDPLLPAGTYRRWHVRLAFARGPRAADELTALLPADQAVRLHPLEATSFFTELWQLPSRLRVLVWRPEVLREDGSRWEPLRRWHRWFGDPANRGYGPRLTEVEGERAVELSNDGGEYLPHGAEFVLA
jgi:hypothetical protein